MQLYLLELGVAGAWARGTDQARIAPSRSRWNRRGRPGRLAGTRKLLALVAREGVELVVFGHDPAQWPTLRRAPAFYD